MKGMFWLKPDLLRTLPGPGKAELKELTELPKASPCSHLTGPELCLPCSLPGEAQKWEYPPKTLH